MNPTLRATLDAFTNKKNFKGKGALCVAIVVTQHARSADWPLDPDDFITGSGGQVLGMGKGAVQTVLKRHGIERVLAKEGGRTSRGSIANMRNYVALLNRIAAADKVNLDEIEAYWIDRINDFFSSKPFKIRLDASKSLRTVVRDVLSQADDRQKSTPGMNYVGAVIQHLIGAKLDCSLGIGNFEHNSFSTSDQQTGRAGDFLIGDVAIHVTTSPGESVIEKCRDNLNEGHRPMLVTLQRGLVVGEGLADNLGIGDRLDIFEVEQFIALNLYELGKFAAYGRKIAVADLVKRYNEIVDEFETDPGLKIEFKQ